MSGCAYLFLKSCSRPCLSCGFPEDTVKLDLVGNVLIDDQAALLSCLTHLDPIPSLQRERSYCQLNTTVGSTWSFQSYQRIPAWTLLNLSFFPQFWALLIKPQLLQPRKTNFYIVNHHLFHSKGEEFLAVVAANKSQKKKMINHAIKCCTGIHFTFLKLTARNNEALLMVPILESRKKAGFEDICYISGLLNLFRFWRKIKLNLSVLSSDN